MKYFYLGVRGGGGGGREGGGGGGKDIAVVSRHPPMWPGFLSRRRRHMWVLTRGFSPGTPVFRSPQKPTFLNSNWNRIQVNEEALCGCANS